VSRPIALVSARHVLAERLDDDLPPLLQALGADAEEVAWDDPAVDWSRFRAAVVRSTWGYAACRPDFLAWADRAGAATRLFNPAAVLRWNTDKRYLAGFERAGVPIVPTCFFEPGSEVSMPDGELVVKPAVGAGSVDTARYGPAERAAAEAHARRLLEAGRVVMVQPYLSGVDRDGETALVYLGGAFSHAIRKGPMLRPGAELVGGLFVKEDIRAREPSTAERDLGERALAAAPGDLLYARVDVAPGPDGVPRLLEFEATEPSLFFGFKPGAAERFAAAIRAAIS
jgi:O-ureido-D-serine cyclo-ligase